MIAERLGLSRQECDSIYLASPLHDIGKVAIPDGILLKPGRLDDDERAIIENSRRNRRANPSRQRVGSDQAGGADRRRPPRAVGRQGISARPLGRGNSARCAHRRHRRRLRRSDDRAALTRRRFRSPARWRFSKPNAAAISIRRALTRSSPAMPRWAGSTLRPDRSSRRPTSRWAMRTKASRRRRAAARSCATASQSRRGAR